MSETKQEAMERLEETSEYALDLDNLPKQTHNWVKRGAVLSCENAGHPNHRHFLVRK